MLFTSDESDIRGREVGRAGLVLLWRLVILLVLTVLLTILLMTVLRLSLSVVRRVLSESLLTSAFSPRGSRAVEMCAATLVADGEVLTSTGALQRFWRPSS